MKTNATLTEARRLAALINSPDFTGDRWSLSMQLSILQKRLGAAGIEAAADAAGSEDECE